MANTSLHGRIHGVDEWNTCHNMNERMQKGLTKMKAMILAAGRGERMRPLTLTTPKPLLKIGNTTLIDRALHQLRQANIKEVVINVHYLKEKIMWHCGDGSRYDLKIYYSIEETLLETGGGVFKALPLLGPDPFLIFSADVWTDYPFIQLTQKKITTGHLVLVNNPAYHLQGDYGLDKNNFLLLDAEKKLTYASFGILHPDLFRDAKPGVFRLTQVWNPAIQKKLITGEHYAGEWHNVGTVEDLKKLKQVN